MLLEKVIVNELVIAKSHTLLGKNEYIGIDFLSNFLEKQLGDTTIGLEKVIML